MQKRGKAQAATEYIMVVGIVLAIIVPMVYVFYSYSTSMGQEVTQSKVDRIATDMINSAEEVYYLGEPSKTTLRFEMPSAVFDINVQNGKDLVFWLGDIDDYQEIIAYSNVEMKNYLIPYNFKPGQQAIRIEAKGDHVALYSGVYEEAVRLRGAYDLAKALMAEARDLLKQELIDEDGNINERNEKDRAYITGSYKENDGTISVSIDELHGRLNYWVGGKEMTSDDIDATRAEDLTLPGVPTMGITLHTGLTGLIRFYYKDTTGNLWYYNQVSQAWDNGAAHNAGSVPIPGDIDISIKADGTDYVFSVEEKKDYGNTISARISKRSVDGPTSHYLFGDTSSEESYVKGQITSAPGSYQITSSGIYRDIALPIPYEGKLSELTFYLDSMKIGSSSFIFDVLMPSGETRSISFDSYVPVRQGATLPTVEESEPDTDNDYFHHHYYMEKSGSVVKIGDLT